MKNNKTLTKVKCSKCGYEWETESEMILVTCPSCMLKSKHPKFKVKNGKTKDN